MAIWILLAMALLGTTARVVVVVIATRGVPPSQRAEVLNAVAQVLRYWGRVRR